MVFCRCVAGDRSLWLFVFGLAPILISIRFEVYRGLCRISQEALHLLLHSPESFGMRCGTC